jgi:osmotically-inducible protein OsmY
VENFKKGTEGTMFEKINQPLFTWSVRKFGQMKDGGIGMVLVFLLSALPSQGLAQTTGVAQNPSIEDSDIYMAVESALFSDPQIPENVIDVEVKDGIVMLEGTVSNLLAKERTTQVVETFKGVRGIVNALQVISVIPSDEQLKQNIIYALAQDPATDAYEIQVNVRYGVVTLSGTVESWQEKELSEKVVKGVTGVRDVLNELEWEPVTHRPDKEIQADVVGRLEADPWITHDSINVQVQNGKVVLSGSIGSLNEKRRARVDAWVAGAKEVEAKDLEVKWWVQSKLKRTSGFESRSDEDIRRAIKDALFYDPRVDSSKLGIAVDGGSVTLTGIVGNLQTKKAAEENTRHTIGVWHVRNLIKVRPQESLTNKEVAENVKTMLKLDPFLGAKTIDVSVRNGRVSLTGTVDYDYEKYRAGDIASRAKGVVNVTNYLHVSSVWTWRSDIEIQNDIRTELWWSPFVDSEEVKVDVEQGTATLTGVVDSWAERTIAEENAYEGGAKDVVNKLNLRHMIGG